MDNTREVTVEDLDDIGMWYAKRGMYMDKSLLSRNGFIVPGVAAGFLIGTDTKACILEPFIANPQANEHERDTALKGILEALVERAEGLGYDYIFGFAASPTMIARAIEQGFYQSETNITVIKELK